MNAGTIAVAMVVWFAGIAFLSNSEVMTFQCSLEVCVLRMNSAVCWFRGMCMHSVTHREYRGVQFLSGREKQSSILGSV